MASFSILSKSGSFIKTLNPNSFRTISTFTFLSQEVQIAETPNNEEISSTPAPPPPSPSSSTTPLPPNPSSGSPIYLDIWRNPNPTFASAQSLVPLGFVNQAPSAKILALSQNVDAGGLMNIFADWMTSQRWNDMKELFEFWLRRLDKNGKPNKPDVSLYNLYLRANQMSGASPGELLDLVAIMEDHKVTPNTGSFNIVLKAMVIAGEAQAAEKLIERMLQTGKEAMPDDESYDLVITMLFKMNNIDAGLKYLDLTLNAGNMVSMAAFTECVGSCARLRRLDTLTAIIERCKKMDQNKALCPGWNLCIYIAEIALRNDNSKLAFFGLEFLARLLARGETSRPPTYFSVDEGLIISALGTAGRTYNSTLLDASWAILRRSLRQKRAPSAESFLAKIYACASLGNLPKAFSTLHELESAYAETSSTEAEGSLFSPFTSLYPLVVACTKNGFETLDSVYFQLENLSRSDPPYKSVAALNCVILGCANTWDLERAYQTFESISSSFELTPDIHSYNALMCAFGKLKKTDEASKVFEHLTGLGMKPNATSFEMLVKAHLINRDPKAALSVIDEMITTGFVPSKQLLATIRRRCVREMDYESDDQVEALAKKFKIRMGAENRRNMLFNLQYNNNFA